VVRYSSQSDQAMKHDHHECGYRLETQNGRTWPVLTRLLLVQLSLHHESNPICVHAVRIRCNLQQSWRDMIKTRQGRWTGTQRVTAMIVSQRALPIVSARPSAAFSAHGPHYQIPCLRLRRKNNCSRIKICSKKLFAMLIKKCSKNKIEMI